jgi:hypothetical protein
VRPACSKYSVTTFEPGASDDFTHGLRRRPRSTAFFASRPAPTMTCGFDVFVHDVIAAITTDPCSSSQRSPSIVTGTTIRLGSIVATGTRTSSAAWSPAGCCSLVGSLAGNVSATASSCPLP